MSDAPRRHAPPPGREALARRVRAELGPVPALDSAPAVSIVVLNLDGERHLRRLLPGLAGCTDYPELEVVVVDNGSTDGSREYLASVELPCPLLPVFNAENASFSDANNQGADVASGELLLFLNNDIEPFEPGWLTELVACLQRLGAGAVGSMLLHARKPPPTRGSGYAIQHRGIRFYDAGGWARGYNLGDGDDLFAGALGEDVACPAVTAACLLIARETFEAVGGFTTGYRYGSEDIDLGLKLTAAGLPVVCAGRSVLFHHESATQATVASPTIRENRLGNQALQRERWGAQLAREFHRDRLTRRGFWTGGDPPHMGITVTSRDPAAGYGDWHTASELGCALEDLGWRISYLERRGDAWYVLPDGLDCLLVLLDAFDAGRVPAGVTTIAWIRNWTDRWLDQPWFRRYDLVLASSRASVRLVERRAGKHGVLFPLATNPDRFADPGDGERRGAVFSGNRWNQPRPIEDAAAELDDAFRVYGQGWEETPLSPFAQGPVPYDELPAIYAGAEIVVDDAATHTLPYGSVNSRVFDALAAGAVVVSNGAQGVRELFDERFPVWDSGASLAEQIAQLRTDPVLRAATRERYRSLVVGRHTYAHRARTLDGLLRSRWDRSGFVFKVGAPDWRRAPAWGDLYFARALQRQLEARGHRSLIQILPEWEDAAGYEYDVAVHLRGLSDYLPKPGQLNVLWCISHPELLSAEECDLYDLVLVASERFAAALRPRTRTPVEVLEQATDPDVFTPSPDPDHACELVFVGNSRKVRRRILADLLPTEHDLAVWGGDWDGLIDPGHVRGAHLPNDQVPRAYSSAAIVLNDHWDDMREHGFVSNRLYDALACGACVVSDHMPEIDARFRGSIITYQTGEELRELIGFLLADPDLRAELGRRGREIVLAEHTFEHRADELLELVERRRRELDVPLGIEPDRNPAHRSPAGA